MSGRPSALPEPNQALEPTPIAFARPSLRLLARLTASVRPQTAHGILRVIAFVLLCIGVQITWNGVETLLKTVLKS